jgi:hypothetical protein
MVRIYETLVYPGLLNLPAFADSILHLHLTVSSNFPLFEFVFFTVLKQSSLHRLVFFGKNRIPSIWANLASSLFNSNCSWMSCKMLTSSWLAAYHLYACSNCRIHIIIRKYKSNTAIDCHLMVLIFLACLLVDLYVVKSLLYNSGSRKTITDSYHANPNP